MTLRPLAAISLIVLLAGCKAASADQGATHYRSGQAAIARGEPRVAMVELLNAIKQDPDNPEYRLAQAKVHLMLGDGAAAEAEIARARTLGVPVNQTRHLMADALSLDRQHDKAVAEATLTPPAHRGYAARVAARSLAALGDKRQAKDALAAAERLAPRDPETWIAIAGHRREMGKNKAAVRAAERALTIDPKNVEALNLLGALARGRGDHRAALAFYNRASAADPQSVGAALGRARALGALGYAKGLLAETRRALRIDGNNKAALFYQANLAAHAGNYRLARTLLERTAGSIDDQPRVMLLRSIIDLHFGNHEQALRRTRLLLADKPKNRQARRLLAAAYSALGDPARAAETLRPLVGPGSKDKVALEMAARAASASGNDRAALLYARRAKTISGPAEALK